MKIVTIHQPNYMPWSGFFHKWLMADVFVILDTVQFHKNDWQNRNRIKTAQGEQWLTVPVNYRFPQKIEDVTIMQNNWVKKQCASIEQAYARSPYLTEYWSPVKDILQRQHLKLADLNIEIIAVMGKMLGCTAPLYLASALNIKNDDPSQRLITITKHFQSNHYLSGSEGRNYLNNKAFSDAGISLLFQSVQPPVYPQFHGAFIPSLSALDVLLNIGEDARELIANMGGMQP